jgi:hypothetical protein
MTLLVGRLLTEEIVLTLLPGRLVTEVGEFLTQVRHTLLDVAKAAVDVVEGLDDGITLGYTRVIVVVGEALELSACLREGVGKLSERRGSGGRHFRSWSGRMLGQWLWGVNVGVLVVLM